MTEEKLEGLLRVQPDILSTLEVYSKLYDRQILQLQQVQLELNRIERMLRKLYVIHYPPALQATCTQCWSNN